MPSCFFIGHRDAREELLPSIWAAVDMLIREESVTDFYVGSRGRFDRMASRVLTQMKRVYPHIHLYLVLAYAPSERPEPLPPGFDGTVWPEGMERVPRRVAIPRANRIMVDTCPYLIAYAPHETGNARKVAEYARRRGRRIIEVPET